MSFHLYKSTLMIRLLSIVLRYYSMNIYGKIIDKTHIIRVLLYKSTLTKSKMVISVDKMRYNEELSYCIYSMSATKKHPAVIFFHRQAF